MKTTLIETINDIVTYMVYHGKEGIMTYKFQESLPLHRAIHFEHHFYNRIDGVAFNPETRKMFYICSTDQDIEQKYIPVNTQIPGILNKVHQRIIQETLFE